MCIRDSVYTTQSDTLQYLLCIYHTVRYTTVPMYIPHSQIHYSNNVYTTQSDTLLYLCIYHTVRCTTVPMYIPHCQIQYCTYVYTTQSDTLLYLCTYHTVTVIHFENGHHESSGPLLIKTMSPKSKAMSPNFISGRNIKQVGKCPKGSLFRERINSESDNRQRKFASFASSLSLKDSFSIQH